jgi:hypothetical protein
VVTGTTNIVATYQGVTGQIGLRVQAVVIVSIIVTPGSASVPKGINQQFRAVATFDDASTQDITQTAVWTSSTPATATISATGLATSVNPGTTDITAAQGGRSNTVTLEVRTIDLVSIVVTYPGGGASASTPKGTTIQFTATGIYTDGSSAPLTVQAVWTSSNNAIATISSSAGSDGLASAGNTLGNTVISATYQGVQGSVVLNVTTEVLKEIQVTPVADSIAKGTDLQFAALGIYTDNSTANLTTSVSWSSATAGTATINAAGLAHGVAVGTSNISATQSGITSNTAVLTVTNETLVSIAVTPTNPADLPDGLTQQFTAIGTFTDGSTQNLSASATWASSVGAFATISATGLATADSPGDTSITASAPGPVGTVTSNAVVLHVTDAVLQTIAITPDPITIPDGVTQQFTAMGHYSDNTDRNITTSVTWTSGSPDKATINPTSGLAQAVDPGSSVITAALAGITDTVTLNVSTAVLQTITLAPANPCIANTTDQQFIATGTFSDTTTRNLTGVATWLSSVVGVATIQNGGTNGGLATAGTVAAGTATTSITASYNAGTGLVTGTTTLSVGVCP